jgi:hypothetical protein
MPYPLENCADCDERRAVPVRERNIKLGGSLCGFMIRSAHKDPQCYRITHLFDTAEFRGQS